MSANPSEIEPLASIADAVAKATEEISAAWAPMAEAGAALAERLRGNADA